jgi:hypothetical protein
VEEEGLEEEEEYWRGSWLRAITEGTGGGIMFVSRLPFSFCC